MTITSTEKIRMNAVRPLSKLALLAMLAMLAMLLAAIVLAYQAGLGGSFVFDDRPNIVGNASLRLFEGSWHGLVDASTNGVASPLGRPLSMASFALNLHFFGAAPYSFKLVNLLIHLANGLLVFVLVRQLWPAFAPQRKTFFPAYCVATAWLLHPINLTPVLFVVQRMTSLAAFFTLAALCLYLAGRRRSGTAGIIAIAATLLVCWPLGLLSKESAASLPLFILLCEYFVLGGLNRFSHRTRIIGICAIAGLGLLALATIWTPLAAGYRFRDFTLIERLLTEARVLWFYIMQILVPLPDLFALHHDDIAISRGLFAPITTLLAMLGWIVAIGAAIILRRRQPLLSFAIAWFLVAHLLESTILPLEIAYEHRNYLASLGILMWLASFLPVIRWPSINAPAGDPGSHGTTRRRLFQPTATATGVGPRLILAASFIGFCGLVTGLRATQWGDDYRRTILEAGTHPDSPRANYEAGIATVDNTFLSSRGANPLAYQAAHFYFDRAAMLDPRGKAAVLDLIYVDCLDRRTPTAANIAELNRRLSSTPFLPADSGLIQSLSAILVENRLCMNDAQVTALLDAVLANPLADRAIRGMTYAVGMDYAAARLHDPKRALAYARAAVAVDPGSVPLRVNQIRLLLASGDQLAARKEYTAVLQMKVRPADRADLDQLREPVNRLK